MSRLRVFLRNPPASLSETPSFLLNTHGEDYYVKVFVQENTPWFEALLFDSYDAFGMRL